VVAAEPPAPRRGLEQAERGSGAAVATAAEAAVLAKPPVRKLARDLGVDLRSVSGTGPEGVITRDDVQSAAGGAAPLRAVPAAGDERIPIRGVRKAMAAAVTASAFTAPHVTEFLTVDVTESMALLERLAGAPEFAELRPSPLLLAARALLVGVRRHPLINSSWDEQRQEVVVHGDVNLGIAAATPRGLLVPNVKAAQRLSLAELAQALADLARTAREGKTAPADMQRGTITITNVGVFGVDNGTPILTPGEAAILCLGAVRDMPWVHEGEIAVRKVTQLALSFDHRLVDGELGSRFLADVGAMLRDPSLLLAWS
jgi:pyruvate dehydrogenase E2 component (dihydrolipoamide acetyltransferase)